MAGKQQRKTQKITDVLGMDFGTTSTKLVRLRKTAGKLSLVDADVMPSFDLESLPKDTRISVPKKLNAPYAAASFTSKESHVRFMFISNKLTDQKSIRQRVGKSIGLGREFRVGFSMVEKGKDDVDHKVLTAAIPESHVQSLRGLMPHHHPSLLSLEISGLSALNSFSHTPAVQEAEGIVCYLEAGAASLFISFFLNGTLKLVRKFDHGSLYIQQRIQDVLNINEDDALTVLFEDASPIMDQGIETINAMVQELSISCKFVERNESSHISTIYASGGLSYSPYWAYIIEEVMGAQVQVWNPFEENGIKNYPKGVHGVESMFSPAIGAALSVM